MKNETLENRPQTLLVVDDDPDIRTLLAGQLESHSYRVLQAANAAEFARVFAQQSVDLVILDLSLPDEDGLSLCRRLRDTSETPVIMLTARGDPLDRITGLELGADDYVCKPFEPRELLARVRTVLRRTKTTATLSPANARHIEFGRWRLDVAMRRVVDKNGRAIILSGTEFRLLQLLIDHAGEVLGRDQINAMGGSHGDDSQARAVDLQISRIRSKLHDTGPTHTIIATVRHQGYSFIAPLRCS